MNLKKGFALLYATSIILIATMLVFTFRNFEGINLDSKINSHINFQARIYLSNLESIAELNRNEPDLQNAFFRFSNEFLGSYEIINNKAFLYIQATNIRTGQTLRFNKEIDLP